MNKNSIIVKITLFFIVLMITIHTIIYMGYHITKQEQIDLLVNRYMKTLFQVHHQNRPAPGIQGFQPFFDEMPPPPPPQIFSKLSNTELNKMLKSYDLEVSTFSVQYLRKNATLLSQDFQWELFEYEGFKYFYRYDPMDKVLIKDLLQVPDKTVYLIGLTVLLNLMFLLFYLYLIKILHPLKSLTKNVIAFSKGDLNIDTSCDKKDEISQLSNEFHNAIMQIRTLSESRNLFLRNIMHELKTPITKGKLQTNLVENQQQQEMFKRIFERLEYLLFEFAKIEQLTSHNIKLKLESYRMVDIIDQAIDILMISKEDLIINVEDNLVVKVDFYLFSLVLKNLIDNGLKYGEKKLIVDINAVSLCVRSEGEPLTQDIQSYCKPFNRSYETSVQSLGLGLYIVQTILKLHGLTLDYDYAKPVNSFCIVFNNN